MFAKADQNQLIQFVSNKNGEINKIVSDNDGFISNTHGPPLKAALVPESEKSTYLKLIQNVNRDGFAYCREIRLAKHTGEEFSFCLFGVKKDNSITLTAIQLPSHWNIVFDEFMKMLNEQGRLLRNAQKEASVNSNTNANNLDKYARTNNELAKLNRTLQKNQLKLEKAYKKIEEISRIDFLTRILNRHSFLLQSGKELRRCTRYGLKVSLMYLDIDHFKTINDSGGHAAGDYVLKRFAEICMDQLRENDLIGRIGGEEFCILLIHTSQAEALTTAERVRAAIENEIFQFEEHSFKVTTSIGLAAYTRDEEIESLNRRADNALYKAKKGGRNIICLNQDERYPPHHSNSQQKSG